MNAVEFYMVSKVYGAGENKVNVVQNVSFSIKKGEFVAIVGKSGSGKSTILNLAGGMDRVTEGSVMVGKTEVGSLKTKELAVFRRREVGFVFQNYSLISVLNAYDNVAFPMLLEKGNRPDKDKIKQLMVELGIWEKRDKFPDELSGGQQQRVAIARALVNKPEIILADEPTGNLDSKNAMEVVTMLKNCCKKHAQTVLMVTHDQEMAQLSDRIIRVSDGKICER